MSERKSTPGPWRVCDEFVLAGGEGREGRVVAMNHDRVHYECEQENEANAILLAAAPELADALRRLLDVVDLNGSTHAPIKQACKLLKRVDGESHGLRSVEAAQQSVNEQQAFLAACREKILYRVPGLNSDEQRRLWEIASGQSLPPERKQCAACGADGCAVCGFTGYVLE